MYRFFLSLRILCHHWLMTLIGSFFVGASLLILVVVMSVMDGFQAKLKETLAGSAADLELTPNWPCDPVKLAKAIEEFVPEVEVAGPFDQTVTLARKAGAADAMRQPMNYAAVFGIDAGREARINRFTEYLAPLDRSTKRRGAPSVRDVSQPFKVYSEIDAASGTVGVVVGRGLAESLNVFSGERIRIAIAEPGKDTGGGMMRLPWFEHREPRTAAEAARILEAEGASAMAIAGGTDLIPNMKRRHQVPQILVSLRGIEALRQTSNGSGLTLGAGLTLTDLVHSPAVRGHYAGLWQAASQIATVHLRNMGTLGGNLCLDTRCNYYNQNYEWRKAIDFCLKKDGEICWVATASKRCVATSSTDTAPMLIALGATVRLASSQGEREIPVADLYRNDGIDYLTRGPHEIVTAVRLPSSAGWKSSYWKLRRRGAFDFPVLGVAAAVRSSRDGTVEEARIALGAVASRPFLTAGGALLVGGKLTDDAIARAATKVASAAKPLDNADFDTYWRKDVVAAFVGYALKEIRGDDMSAMRLRIARQALQP